jgi:c-di-GMP-binding flagellar brake protein YcgR
MNKVLLLDLKQLLQIEIILVAENKKKSSTTKDLEINYYSAVPNLLHKRLSRIIYQSE